MTVISSWLDPVTWVKCDLDSNSAQSHLFDLWALPCGVVLYWRWKNDVHLSFESFFDLHIDEQHKYWFWAHTHLLKDYNLMICSWCRNSLIFFLPDCFACSGKAKIRKPCRISMISDHSFLTYLKKIGKYLFRCKWREI